MEKKKIIRIDVPIVIITVSDIVNWITRGPVFKCFKFALVVWWFVPKNTSLWLCYVLVMNLLNRVWLAMKRSPCFLLSKLYQLQVYNIIMKRNEKGNITFNDVEMRIRKR